MAMTDAGRIDEFRQFMAELRHAGGHLGLEPECTAIESFVTAEGEAKLVFLRENIDRFFFGRGMKVLERLEAKAAELGRQSTAEGLSQLRAEISRMFEGQFLFYESGQFLPQSAMLREMLSLVNEGRADDILASIDRDLEHLEGHFFMILSEAMRNAHARGEEPTRQLLIMIGRVAAQHRLARKLPCSFAFLYGA